MLTMAEAREVESRVCYREPTATCLYRLFDDADRLLYIGITRRRLSERFNGHAREKPWWNRATQVAVEWFDSDHAALAAEVAAIRSEQPIHNKRSARLSERLTESFSERHRSDSPPRARADQGGEGSREGSRENYPRCHLSLWDLSSSFRFQGALVTAREATGEPEASR